MRLGNAFILVAIGVNTAESLAASTESPSPVRWWLTTADSDGNPIMLLEEQQPLSIESAEYSRDNLGLTENAFLLNITIDTSVRHQNMTGFGAGLPQSSARVLMDLKTMNPDAYSEVMSRLFGIDLDKNESIGISLVRFPLGSCDFSIGEFSYDDTADDWALEKFQIDDDSLLIAEVLSDAKAINPSLKLMAAAWSPPAWLKVGGAMDGDSDANTLLADAFSTYATYLGKAAEAWFDLGLPLDVLALQNEPLFGTANYPGMYLSAADAVQLGTLTAPLVAKYGTVLAAYDHNWDHPEYALEVLGANYTTTNDWQQGKDQEEVNKAVFGAGTAFHCYAGSMEEAHESVHAAWPLSAIHVSECTGSYPDDVCDLSRGMEGFWSNHEWDMRNLFLGAASHWSSSGLKWVMALDQDCGPVLPQVEYRWARPLVNIPLATTTVTTMASGEERGGSTGTLSIGNSDVGGSAGGSGGGDGGDALSADVPPPVYNQDFFTVGHMSKFVPHGSVRVESTTATTISTTANTASGSSTSAAGIRALGGGDNPNVLAESFLLPDGVTVAFVLLNSEESESLDLTINKKGLSSTSSSGGDVGTITLTAPPRSTVMIVW